jgi:hypothetical protein
MKKIYAMKLFTLVLVLLGQVTNGFGQVTTLGNVNGTATDFLGWNNTVTIGLNINHKTNSTASDINFLTRNTQRMQLNDNGLLGLGLTNQSSLLHLGRTTNSLGNLFRTDGLSNEVTNWTLFTGATIATVVERFRLYADATTTPWIGLRSASNGLRFETAGAFPRMRINGNSTATVNGFAIDNTGFVALVSDQTFWTDINSIKTPYSLLHLAGSGANYSTSSYTDHGCAMVSYSLTTAILVISVLEILVLKTAMSLSFNRATMPMLILSARMIWYSDLPEAMA